MQRTGIAVVGAGMAGIATAYYLCTRYGQRSVLLVDPRAPMSYTSAQSGDNYRDWWPEPEMVEFTGHSIDLLESLARQTGNVFRMTRRGYLLATRQADIDDRLADLDRAGAGSRVRFPEAKAHRASLTADWESAPDGIDVLRGSARIRDAFPALSGEFRHLIHIRRAGSLDSQQLGTYMLEQVRAAGGQRMCGEVTAVGTGAGFDLEISTGTGRQTVRADVLVDAAGPFAGRVAAMLGVELPLANVFQQKIAFEDTLAAVPRDLPFAIDLDPLTLDWDPEVRDMLAADPERSWLTESLPGGRHCRPEGSRWVKLGWAYNSEPAEPLSDLANEPALDEQFPEIVIRGAATLLPALARYVDAPPSRYSLYGGYYTRTAENWPIIGPLGVDGAFTVAGLSGFGSMAACAAGFTCAAWACGADLPSYAADMSLQRYADPARLEQLRANVSKSIL